MDDRDGRAPRDSLADRYRIERELGEGGMATVYLRFVLAKGAGGGAGLEQVIVVENFLSGLRRTLKP